MKTQEKTVSTYEKWLNREIGNFGSFHTALLEAYMKADEGNRAKLEQVFPEWFLPKQN